MNKASVDEEIKGRCESFLTASVQEFVKKV